VGGGGWGRDCSAAAGNGTGECGAALPSMDAIDKVITSVRKCWAGSAGVGKETGWGGG
jgi:hypothetical protein